MNMNTEHSTNKGEEIVPRKPKLRAFGTPWHL